MLFDLSFGKSSRASTAAGRDAMQQQTWRDLICKQEGSGLCEQEEMYEKCESYEKYAWQYCQNGRVIVIELLRTLKRTAPCSLSLAMIISLFSSK